MSSASETHNQVQAIIEQLTHYVPVMVPYLSLEQPLRDYSTKLHQFTNVPIHNERQELIRSCLRKKVTDLFGEAMANRLALCIDGGLTVNIVDHHQVLNHPILIAGNVVVNVSRFFSDQPPPIVVISSGDVPPSNFFSKNGFQFHGKRIPLFSNAEKEDCTYFIPKRDFNFISKLKTADRWKEFSGEEKKFLEGECSVLQTTSDIQCTYYRDQISFIVKNQWKRLFNESIRTQVPDLLYVTQEEMAAEALVTLLAEKNVITDLLFDAVSRQVILDEFSGIVVAWNETEHKGTHFFWRKYPGRNQALRMYLRGDMLVPDDARFADQSIPFEREVLIDLLRRQEIFPNLFLIFWVLHFYSGVKPLLGFGSFVYMHTLSNAWLRVCELLHLAEEREHIAAVDLSGLVAGPAVFFKKNHQGLAEVQYAVDIIYGGGVDAEYLHRVFAMPFRALMAPALPDIYTYFSKKYIPIEKRLEVTVTSADIAQEFFSWVS